MSLQARSCNHSIHTMQKAGGTALPAFCFLSTRTDRIFLPVSRAYARARYGKKAAHATLPTPNLSIRKLQLQKHRISCTRRYTCTDAGAACLFQMRPAHEKMRASHEKMRPPFEKMRAAFFSVRAAQKRPRPWDVFKSPAFFKMEAHARSDCHARSDLQSDRVEY